MTTEPAIPLDVVVVGDAVVVLVVVVVVVLVVVVVAVVVVCSVTFLETQPNPEGHLVSSTKYCVDHACPYLNIKIPSQLRLIRIYRIPYTL